jgi:hypothetical protein
MLPVRIMSFKNLRVRWADPPPDSPESRFPCILKETSHLPPVLRKYQIIASYWLHFGIQYFEGGFSIGQN